MNIAFIPLVSIPILLVGYFIYGKWLSRKIFGASDKPTPAVRINDGADYVPTHSAVLFGHHFATIAGAGPIVGPILAVVYGWAPAWLWLIFGAIFMGAVHDFAALFVSIREEGKSVAEVVRKYLGNTGYFLFISFLLIMLTLVTAAFLSLTAVSLTSKMPLNLLKVKGGKTILKTTMTESGKFAPAIVGTDSVVTAANAKELKLAPHQKVYPSILLTGNFDTMAAAIAAAQKKHNFENDQGAVITANIPNAKTKTHSPTTFVAVKKGIIGGIASTSVIIITIFAPLLGFLLSTKKSNKYLLDTFQWDCFDRFSEMNIHGRARKRARWP